MTCSINYLKPHACHGMSAGRKKQCCHHWPNLLYCFYCFIYEVVSFTYGICPSYRWSMKPGFCSVFQNTNHNRVRDLLNCQNSVYIVCIFPHYFFAFWLINYFLLWWTWSFIQDYLTVFLAFFCIQSSWIIHAHSNQNRFSLQSSFCT